jgi:hypothetical protein
MLVETCRVRAATNQGPNREFYQRLEDLVLPWLTPMVMERSDRDILFSLLCRSREVERALKDRSGSFPRQSGRIDAAQSWRWAAIGIWVCFVVTALLFWGWIRQ